jgi:hypothetical protein
MLLPESIPIPDEWPKLCEAQPAMGNAPPTFDPSAPAALWVMAPGKPGLRLKPRKEITRIPGTLEELVPGACGLMKSGHTAIIVHGGEVWLAERIREAAEELKRRRL